MASSTFLSRRFALAAVLAMAVALGTSDRLFADPSPAYSIGQKIEVREGDIWSSATILQKEGRRYLIHYANSDSTSDEWVGTDRMRVAAEPGANAPSIPWTTPQWGTPSSRIDAPSPPATPPPATPVASSANAPVNTPPPAAHHSGFNDPPDEVIAPTTPNVDKVSDEKLAEAPAKWAVPTDVVNNDVSPQSWGLRSHRSERDMFLQHVLACQGGGAVVSFANNGPRLQTVERVGTASGPLLVTLPTQCVPKSASPDGTVLACRAEKYGNGNNCRVDVFTLSHSKQSAVPLVSFIPYPAESAKGRPEDVHGMLALTNKRIITADTHGRVIAWDIAAGSVIGAWRVNVGMMNIGDQDPVFALSPTSKWLAIASDDGVTFVDPQTGSVLGIIPNSTSDPVTDLCCSTTGKTLIAWHGMGALASYDVAAGNELRTISLPQNIFGSLECPDDGFALVSAARLINALTGAPIDAYKTRVMFDAAVAGPGATILASMDQVTEAHVPPPAIREAAAKASDDSALAVKPGTNVQLDIQVDMSDADKSAVTAAIRKKLTDNGLIIADHADIVVMCRTVPGQTIQHTYAQSHGIPFIIAPAGGGTTVSLTDKITRITIQQNGKTIWERTDESVPASSFPLKDGQSIQEQAAATIQYNPRFLENIVIPKYIAKPQ